MKRILPVALLLIVLLGFSILPGCDTDVIDLDTLKNTFFNTAINYAILAIDKELGGDVATARIGWIESTMEENFGSVLDDLEDYGIDWRASIDKAYRLVFAKATDLLKSKLALPEYEGADPQMYLILGPEDFVEWRDEVIVEN